MPPLAPGASAGSRTHVAERAQAEALGYPGALAPDWEAKAIGRLGELVEGSRALRLYMDACMKCGACADKCHYYLGTGDPKNMPVARQDLLRSVYRRHFTLAGRHFPKLVGAEDLDRDKLEDWFTYFHQCSQCRRCAHYCPVGIDTAEISMAAREIMASAGLAQRYTAEVVAKVHTLGNNLGMGEAALADTLSALEDEVEEDTGVRVRFPLDEHGAEILLVTPSADFYAEPHVDGLIGYAKVLHQAGLSWTLSAAASEAANFALFMGSEEHLARIARRIGDAARALGVRRIVFGECGHAWRVGHNDLEALAGPLEFLDRSYPVPQHMVELTADLLRRGALTLDREANDARRMTFHDSCNVARGSSMGGRPGGQLALPRALITASCNHYVEMPAGTTGAETFCCGGGGGLLGDEMMDLRIKGAKPRMDALQHVIEHDGVTHMAAICAICKTQFSSVFPEYGLERDRVLSLHQLVGDAVILGAKS